MKPVNVRIEHQIKEALKRLSTEMSLSETIRHIVKKGITLQEKGETFIETDNLSIPISKIRLGIGTDRLVFYINEEQCHLAKKVFKEDDTAKAMRRALIVGLCRALCQMKDFRFTEINRKVICKWFGSYRSG